MADRTDHLIMLIGMMGSTSSAGDGEGVNAFRMASRELTKQGLTWRDIAERALRAPPVQPRGIWQGEPVHREPPPRRREPNNEYTSAAPPPPPPKDEPPPIKKRLTGFDVQAAISGVVRILDDDRKSKLLIVEVEGRDVIYGPLIAYAGTVRDSLLAANNKQSTLRIRPPRHETSMPQIVGCRSI